MIQDGYTYARHVYSRNLCAAHVSTHVQSDEALAQKLGAVNTHTHVSDEQSASVSQALVSSSGY